MSDHQRQRVYKAEWAVRAHERRLPSIDHVRALVRIVESLDWFPEDKRGIVVSSTFQTSKAFYSRGTIHLPAQGMQGGEWAWTDLTVIHEIAHHLAPDHGHDRAFTHFVVRIFQSLGRTQTAQALRDSYVSHGAEVWEAA